MDRTSKTRQQLLLEIEELRARLAVAQQRLHEANERMQAGMTGCKRAEEALEGVREGLEEHQTTLVADLARANEQLVASEEALKERVKFETLLADLSARFVNLPAGEIDGNIIDAQRHLCEFLDLDRSTLLQVSEAEHGAVLFTHVHQPPGTRPPPERVDARNYFPWTTQKALSGEVVAISKMSDLPPEAARDQENFRLYGTTSVLVIPLLAGGGTVLGALTFAVMREERNWPEATVKGLRLIAQVFANALDRKRADQVLRESEERLHLATEAAGAGLWIMELDTNKVWVTAKTRELFQFAPDEELNYESFFKVIHAEDHGQVHRAIEQVLQSGQNLRVEYRIVPPGGGIRWIMSRGRPYYNLSGKPNRLMGVSFDVTDRKQAEENLNERLRFEQLLSEVSSRFAEITVHEVDAEVTTALTNIREFLEVDRIGLVQVSPQEATWQVTHVAYGTGVSPVPVGVDLPAARFPWITEKLMTHREVLSFSSVDELPHEAAIDRQTCEELGVKSFMNIPIRVGGVFDYIMAINAVTEHRRYPLEYVPRLRLLGEIFVGAIERKRTELEAFAARRELLRSERLHRMGELTASLAHELNQPLTAILSNARAALRFIESGTLDMDELKEILQDIASDDKRAGDIIRTLRSMVKPEEGEREPVAINDVLLEVVTLFHSEAVMRNIKVEVDLADAVPQAVINKVQLQQVVVNLMLNAAESMLDVPDDKRVVIRSRANSGAVQVAPASARRSWPEFSSPSSPQSAQGSAWGYP
jgi:PAS domain S-box-containing protein